MDEGVGMSESCRAWPLITWILSIVTINVGYNMKERSGVKSQILANFDST